MKKIMKLFENIMEKLGLKIVGHVDMDALRGAQDEEAKILAELDERRSNVTAEISKIEKDLAEVDKRMSEGEEEMCKLAQRRAQCRLKLDYLESKNAIRENYQDFSLSNEKRQKDLRFSGIRPQRMDVVHFYVPQGKGVEEMDGVALVKDENHYYLAVDMYEHPDREDNISTLLDENPDGTFEGVWPKSVVLKKAQKFEERFMRQLADKYADDIEAANAKVELCLTAETEERKDLRDSIVQLDAKLAVYDMDQKSHDELTPQLESLRKKLKEIDAERRKHSAAYNLRKANTTLPVTLIKQDPDENPNDSVEFNLNEPEYEPVEGLELDTEVEKQYPHLPYLRGKRKMLTMNWPMIEDAYEPWLRYRLMANVSRLVSRLQKNKALTYVLTQDYFDELCNRGKNAYRGMTVQDVVSEGEVMSGVLVFPNQGFEDTVIYEFNCSHQMSIMVVYIREGRLLFYESFSVQEIVGSPRIDTFLAKTLRDTGTDSYRLFSFIRNFVISFLAMEKDMERTVNHLIEEGKGSAIESQLEMDEDTDTTDDKDVVVRDANWYTDITVNRIIPVRGYISHRWCGSGKEKYIKEVWVRPHVKQGYHREAGVHN